MKWSTGHHLVQWEEDIPMTTTVPELEGSQIQDPSDSPAYHTGTLPPHCLSWLIIPLLALPQLDTHLLDSLLAPMQKKAGLLPSVAYPVFSTTSGSMSTPKWSRVGRNMALCRARRTCQHWHQRLAPAPNHKAGTYQLLFQSNQGHCWSWWWYSGREPCGAPRIRTARQHQPQWDLI